MTVTQTYLNNEITLAKKIFLYYTDKVISYLNIGSDKYIKWYIDSLQLYFLLKYLENVSVSSELYYIGAEEILSEDVVIIFSKVREYYKSDIDVDYGFGELPIPIIPSYRQPFVADWKEFTITVDSDRPSTLTLPVNLTAIADKESIQCVVNGISDPDYHDDAGLDGYHIINNILYWHSSNFYDLIVGTTVRIQYLQIVG